MMINVVSFRPERLLITQRTVEATNEEGTMLVTVRYTITAHSPQIAIYYMYRAYHTSTEHSLSASYR
jgi:hypothetical protein